MSATVSFMYIRVVFIVSVVIPWLQLLKLCVCVCVTAFINQPYRTTLHIWIRYPVQILQVRSICNFSFGLPLILVWSFVPPYLLTHTESYKGPTLPNE